MSTEEQTYQRLVKIMEGIRDERGMYANTATRIGSALLELIHYAADNGRYISKIHDDTANGHIKLTKGATFGTFNSGVEGARIDDAGNAELQNLLVRAKAALNELDTKGEAVFHSGVTSDEFISGFLGGKGWAIYKTIVKNALGIDETKWTGEMDNLVIRGTLRIFSLVVSQMLGENDNRIFTAMLEVDHYDPQTGRVWLDTRDGKLYNPFRKDDYIMVQQYNGMPSEENNYYITKHYECIVTEVGMGDLADGENRLDWVKVENFVSADGRPIEEVITKGDTFCRVDNATDADRKGIIQIITVGTAAPYMDVIYGLKTDPENALKGRLGNLAGIRHPLFGQLYGFGEMLCNLFAVGDFRLKRTGESLDQSLEVLKGKLSSRIARTEYELTDEDNYLTNARFADGLTGWTADDNGTPYMVTGTGGNPMMINGAIIAGVNGRVKIENHDGKDMLRLQGSGITQSNSLIRQPATHSEMQESQSSETSSAKVEVQDELYMSIKILPSSAGTLTVGFDYSGQTPSGKTNTLPFVSVNVPRSMEWQVLQWKGTWHGLGNFRLHYTGDCLISFISITDKAIDELRKTVSTSIEQTATNIRLLGENIDVTNGRVTSLGLDLDAANGRITTWVESFQKTLSEDYYTKTEVIQTAESWAVTAESNAKSYTDESITTAKSSLTVDIDGVRTSVETLSTNLNENYYSKTEVNQTADGIRTSVETLSNNLNDNYYTSTQVDQLAGEWRSTVIGIADDNIASSLDAAKEYADNILSTAQSYANGIIHPEYVESYDTPGSGWSSDTWARRTGSTWKYLGKTGVSYTTLTGNAAAVSGHTYRFLGIGGAWEDVTDIAAQCTYISQSKGKISLVAANFDANGNVLSSSGIVTTANFNKLWCTGGNGNTSYFVQSGDGFLLDGSLIQFVGKTMINGNFIVDESGNVTMKNCTIANGTNAVMKLGTDGNNGGLFCYVGDKQLMSLVYAKTDRGLYSPELQIYSTDKAYRIYMNAWDFRVQCVDTNNFGFVQLSSSGGKPTSRWRDKSGTFFDFGYSYNGTNNGKIYWYVSDTSMWMTSAQATKGCVYLENGYLKVKTA